MSFIRQNDARVVVDFQYALYMMTRNALMSYWTGQIMQNAGLDKTLSRESKRAMKLSFRSRLKSLAEKAHNITVDYADSRELPIVGPKVKTVTTQNMPLVYKYLECLSGFQKFTKQQKGYLLEF